MSADPLLVVAELTASVERAEAEIVRLRGERDEARAEVERLRKQVAIRQDELDRWIANRWEGEALDNARAEVARLRDLVDAGVVLAGMLLAGSDTACVSWWAEELDAAQLERLARKLLAAGVRR